MTYDEAMEPGTIVSREETREELNRHSCTMADFEADHGVHPTYPASVVLGWLGY